MCLGSGNSKHANLESLQFGLQIRSLSIQSFGNFPQFDDGRIPGQAGFHTCRPAGSQLDGLHALGQGLNDLRVAHLITRNRRSGRHLVECQIFAVFALLNLVGFIAVL